ncbi:putative aspartic-type endopeptidase opsB [Lachnellula suecica]|uniref:Probable aspartic-type endopeptidase OPSB n=1 Tax=Lachnellula suecica TaxID=602035 RepID=A0A8T9BTP2_9HELO|nr:putative aspartic-type endopeptidase opsB [Lachnellula suecica]
MASLRNTLVMALAAGASANTLRMDIARNPAVAAAQIEERSSYLRSRALSRRASDTVTAALENDLTAGLYSANITVGTPGQTLAVQIDTGSSDVWVPAPGLSICSEPASQGGGCAGGTFDHSSSSTFSVVEQDGFNISYVDGTGVAGDYFSDMFAIGGATVKGLEMGLASSGTIGQGIMGIGYNTSEANIDTGNGTVYPNLPNQLVDEGLINSLAYSLWLNDLDSSTGSILFGGIDTDKYSGNLISVDVYPTTRSKQVVSFTVAFTSLSATSSSGTDVLTPSDYAEAAILDSGTTITLLPDALAEMVFEELGALYEESLGAAVVPCSLANKNGTLNFGFGGSGGPVISVGVDELVLPLTLTSGSTPKINGQDACQLGIMPAGDLPILFGDTFMRSAYVVYDLVNNRIGLANTDFNATGSNVVPFASSGAAIPSASTAPNEAAITQTATGNPKVDVTPTAGGVTSATYNPTATGLSAASGFTAASSSSSKKNGGVARPEPFAWSRVLVGLITVALMGAGGLFHLL